MIDIDSQHGATREAITDSLGCDLDWDESLLQRTPSGGEHHGFALLTGDSLRQGDSLLGIKGFDTRVAGKGWIATGKGYEDDTIFGIDDPDVWRELPALPDAAVSALCVGNGFDGDDGDADGTDGLMAELGKQRLDGIDIESARRYIERLPADDLEDYGAWLKPGMALHHQFDGSDEALTLWVDWSRDASTFDEAECRRKWSGFGDRSGVVSPTRFDYVIYRAGGRIAAPNPGSVVKADAEITPFADPLAIGIGDMLDTAPPERRWLLDDLLPLGVVGLLAAGGGTGKSFFTMQMAIAVATGRPFMGIPVGEPGGVLMICAEDERDELHRRFWRIVNQMRTLNDFPGVDPFGETIEADGLTEDDVELLRQRLFIQSAVGADNRLTAEHDRTVVRTDVGARIGALVEQLPSINLVVLDPVSRFRGGDENANDAATRFVESVEALRASTGATVLLPHHVNKGALTAGSEAISIEGLRGASALLDGVRWAMGMATLRKDHAGLYGIDPEDSGNYVRIDAVKNNYAPPWQGQWLERLSGGVLSPVEMLKRNTSAKDEHKAQQAEDRFHDVVEKVQSKVREAQEKGKPLTRRQLSEYAGASGVFGVGDQTLRGIVSRAIDESYIAAHKPDGERYEVLKTWR